MKKITTHFMHNQLGKSSTNDETGNHFHALEMHELLSSAMDVKIEIPTRINVLSAKTDKKGGEGVKKP